MLERVISELVRVLTSLRVDKPRYSLLSNDTEPYTAANDVEIRVIKDFESSTRTRSNFYVGALDASSVTFHVGFSEISLAVAACIIGDKLAILPRLSNLAEVDVPIISSYVGLGEEVSWITDKYVKLRTKYVNDPALPEGALAHDIRISLETYVIRKVLTQEVVPDIILIDGPIEYPLKHPIENSLWNSEIVRLNKDRVEALRFALRRGSVPVAVVKRVWGSKYIKGSTHTNDAYLIVRTLVSKGLDRYPVYIGPLRVEGRNVRKQLFYVVIPINAYTGSFTILRLEFLNEAAEKLGDDLYSVINYIVRSSMRSGLPIPYKLHQVDRVCKKVITSIAKTVDSLLRVKGVPMLYGGVVIEWG